MSGTPCIVGRLACGCISYVNADPDHLDRHDRASIARIVAEGGTIERSTVEATRRDPQFMRCTHGGQP